MDKRKTMVLDTLFDQRSQFFWFGGKTARYKADIETQYSRNGVEL